MPSVNKLLATTAIVASLGLAAMAPAHAAPVLEPTLSIDFNAGNTFSGVAPVGSFNATFEDLVGGGVQLTLTSHANVANNEFVQHEGFFFNFNPAKDLNNLSIAYQSDVGGITGAPASITKDLNNLKPDGDGFMDFEIAYPSGSNKAFKTPGEVETFLLSGIAGLTASDFDFMSVVAGNGSHLAAVHISDADSGWAGPGSTVTITQTCVGNCDTPPPAIPEPMSILLFGTSAMGLAWARRSGRKNSGR